MKLRSRCITGFLLAVLIVSPVRLIFFPQVVHAQFSPSDIIPVDKLLPDGLVKNKEALEKSFKIGVAACAVMAVILYEISQIPGIKVPVERLGDDVRNNFLNCIVYHVVNTLIEDMLRSLTSWVQTGFKGNPVFVTQLNGYLMSIADQTFGAFIEENIPFLCSPFRSEIALQLIQTYRDARGLDYGLRSQCTFTEAIGNMDAFLSGDFSQGGWEGWLHVTANPYNNPYGAYLQSAGELAFRLESATGQEEKKLDFGRGFLTPQVQDCYLYSGGDQEGPPQPFTIYGNDDLATAKRKAGVSGYGEVECDPKRDTTPGAFIEDQIERKYGLPDQRLTFADELNELINAVILYLVNNIFNIYEDTPGGLAGYDINSEEPVPFLNPGIGDNTGDDPTPGDSEQPGPPGPSMCFTRNGTFLTPTQGGAERGVVSFPIPQNVSYDSIVLELDVTNSGWLPDRNGWPYNIFWLARDGNKNMFGYVNVFAPNKDDLMLRHGIGQSHKYKSRKLTNMTFPENATYHFTYTYDADGNTINIQVTDKDTGQNVASISSVPDVEGINVGNETFRATFGFRSTEESAKERPSYGWEYSNLRVQFLTDGDGAGTCDNITVGTGGGAGGGGGDDDDDNTLYERGNNDADVYE